MEYLIHIAILVCIYGILGLSLNLVMGEAGLVSVAQAAFYGLGAYSVGLMLTGLGWNFFAAAALGMLVAGGVALLVGLVFSRFRGEFYMLGTVGFNIIAWSVALNWQELTHGPLGVPGISRPELFGLRFADNLSFLILAAIVALVVYGLSHLITRSSFGRVLHAIREDEEALSVFGYATSHYKLVIFIISAMLASIAGALFASYITFIDPSSFTLNESILILSIIILGGLGSHRGAILGALLLIVLPEALRFVGFPPDVAAQMRQVAYGLTLILLMLYRPQGLLGTFRL
jgi:branched-chain amino acid transport system permease protein